MTKDKDNVVGLFTDKGLIDFLAEALEKAKTGEIKSIVAIVGNEDTTGFAVIGLEDTKEVIEAIGALELVKTHLVLSVGDDEE